MRISLIVSSLILGAVALLGTESIYDGTGSLINSSQSCWGCNKDEADMQIHKNKNSTVTFQVLKNEIQCTHVDIHTDIDMKQDVLISLKSWSSDKVERSYKVKLPMGKYNEKSGISLELNHLWTTIAISSTKPINKITPIYAYCRGPIDELNQYGLERLSPTMTELEDNHFHLGNGSLITISSDNGQSGYGIVHDLAVTSKTLDAETSFQILSDKNKCKEITIYSYNNEIGKFVESLVEDILIKGWSSERWSQTSCSKLPCTLDTFFNKDGSPNYMLVNIKTKANSNKQLYTECGKKDNIDFNINEKFTKPKNQHSCDFLDLNHDWSDKYIIALCSAGIIEGYGHTGYTEYGPNNPTLWQELVKVVTLSNNFYRTKKFVDNYKITHSYSDENWQLPYLELASKQNYKYHGDMKVSRGVAFQYVTDIFWNKKLSETEAANFLKNKKVINDLNTDRYLTRAEMAKVVLNSARYSADDNGIDRKLPYTNHKDTMDDKIEKDKDIPKPSFESPREDDTESKKDEILNKNMDRAKKENIVSPRAEENETDNNELMKNLIGKNIIKNEFKDKSGRDIKDIIEDRGQLNTSNNDKKDFPSKKINFMKDEKTKQIFPAISNENGEILIEANIENKNTGEIEKKVEIFNKDELEKKGIRKIGDTDLNNIRKKKSDY